MQSPSTKNQRVILLIGESGVGKSHFINFLAEKVVAEVGGVGKTGTLKVNVYETAHEILSDIHIIDTIGFNHIDGKDDFESFQQMLAFFFKNPKYKYKIDSIIYFEQALSSKLRITKYLDSFSNFFRVEESEIIKSFIQIITKCNGQNKEDLQEQIEAFRKKYNPIPIIEWESKRDPIPKQFERLKEALYKCTPFPINLNNFKPEISEIAKKLREDKKVAVEEYYKDFEDYKFQNSEAITHKECDSSWGIWTIPTIGIIKLFTRKNINRNTITPKFPEGSSDGKILNYGLDQEMKYKHTKDNDPQLHTIKKKVKDKKLNSYDVCLTQNFPMMNKDSCYHEDYVEYISTIEYDYNMYGEGELNFTIFYEAACKIEKTDKKIVYKYKKVEEFMDEAKHLFLSNMVIKLDTSTEAKKNHGFIKNWKGFTNLKPW